MGSGSKFHGSLPTRGGTGGEGTGPSGNGGGFDSSTFSYPESEKKYDGYLLDENHPKGGSKAKFLKDVLGYQKGDGPALHNAIGEAINGTKPVSTEKTPYGIKAEFHTTIKGKDGTFRDAKVVVIVQNDNGKTTWKLITLYPGKKDK